MVLPAPFLQCKPHHTPGGSGLLADTTRTDEEFRKAFDVEVDGWLPVFPEVFLPPLTGEVLADVVRRKGATAGSWMVGDGGT